MEWGKWTFSPEVQTKIDLLCSDLKGKQETSMDDQAWHWLINKVKHYGNLKKPQETLFTPVACRSGEEELMEISFPESLETTVVVLDDPGEAGDSGTVENNVIFLLNALDSTDCDVNIITDSLKVLSNNDLISMIREVWPQLNTDSSRLYLCESLAASTQTSTVLCQYILLPWLSDGKCTCIESVSEILQKCADVACKALILPLLKSKDSPFVRDIFALKDFTVRLKSDHCCSILSDFIRSFDSGLEKWHLPVIVVCIQSAQGASRNCLDEALNDLMVLMTCHVKDFSRDRDFGNIMIGVINCFNVESSSFLIKQMTDLVQTYSGPLRFKASNMLKSLNS